jgi:uncharacterized protein YbjT (DUF2867 family)
VYLIAGATGNVGSELVRLLADQGQPVRAITRDGRSDRLPAGVAQVAGDLNDPESLRPALAGVRAMFQMPGYQGAARTLGYARAAGVEHVVLLSGSSVLSTDTSNFISTYMLEAEADLKSSGLPWTVIRPYAFMSNTLQWIPQLKAGDVVTAPFAGVRQAVTDPSDIAAVAALALAGQEHAGKTYPVTGPQSLLPADRVRILGDVLGRNLELRPQPDDEARAEMSATMPEKYVAAFFSFYAEGTLDESVPLTTVADLTGRPPRTFEQWARTHAAAFSP